MKVLAVAGARPNFMKIAPLMRVLQQTPGIQTLLVHTGQHYDEKMSQLFFDELKIPKPDMNLEVGSGSVSTAMAKILLAFEPVLLAYDVGRAINPAMIRGQMIGGFAQGLGGALMEEFRYADNGQPLMTSLADYLMPTACDVPPIDILLCEDEPSDRNPLGIKGAGECGIAPVGALVASAVDDALQAPGAITELPVTPMRLKRIVDALARVPAVLPRKVAPC